MKPQAKGLPSHSRVIVIGGGIIGTSVAYHLAKLGRELKNVGGWRGGEDVLLLERGKLTCGSTFHAAGLVGQLRTSANITQLLKYSVQLYDTLEAEVGLQTGWKRNGGLRLACNKDRWVELKRHATTAHSFGLEMHLLSPEEAYKLWPVMDPSDLVGAAFLPTDGQVNPSDVTAALAKGARTRGVTIVEDCPVAEILQERGRVTGVVTASGETIEAEVVVNCAGQWANEIGKLAGVRVPLCSVQHQYIITDKVPGILPNAPSVRDPDRLIYFKEEVGGLSMGGYEPNPVPWRPWNPDAQVPHVHGAKGEGDELDPAASEGEHLPKDFIFQLLQNDVDHFSPLLQSAVERVPALANVGVKRMINGPESFTPDGNFILGESPELEKFFVGAGFNAFGIASAGGAGRALAEWVLHGSPTSDLWPVDIRRFGAQPHGNRSWVFARTLEAYAHHYSIAWPGEELESARNVRKSALYDDLKAQGAVFGSKMGWERPNWFAKPALGDEPKDVYSFGRSNWHTRVGEEHRLTRESVTVFDESSFAKIAIEGPSAMDALSWLCANDINKPVGSLTYTQMCNDKGGIECDVTVARAGEEFFYLTTGTAFLTHDLAYITRSIPEGLRSGVAVQDMTDTYGVLGLMGPKSRVILEQAVDPAVTPVSELSNEKFPFATCKPIRIAGVDVLALRITFVGELGWELHVPTFGMKQVYTALMEAGEECSIQVHNAGYRAIESLRLEKGYRVWSGEIGPDYTPLEAGLGWAVKFKSGLPFRGRDALLAQKAKPLTKLLACFTAAPDVILHGRETIYRNGERVGWLATGGFGYTVDKSIGYGYVRNPAGLNRDWVLQGDYTLEVATELVPCTVHLEPLYDPKNLKVKS